MKEPILKEFDETKSQLEDFRKKIELLVQEILSNEHINIHQITSRLKEREKLSEKISRKDDKYTMLSEITDIVGVRAITYLESDVDRVATILEREFIKDDANSIDKRKLQTDQFGYRSLHYVLSLNSNRYGLTELKRFKGIKFEIQIRSILQHAWAEIEHDLGYQALISIPDNSKRSFNRLAALLETADIEFDRLKKELGKYENEVSTRISQTPELVQIDKPSLISFSEKNRITLEAFKIIHNNSGASFIDSHGFEGIIDKFLNFFKFTNIKDIEGSLESNEDEYLKIVNFFSRNLKTARLPLFIPFYYFQHLLVAKTKNKKYINDYLSFGKSHISGPVEYFLRAYKETKN